MKENNEEHCACVLGTGVFLAGGHQVKVQQQVPTTIVLVSPCRVGTLGSSKTSTTSNTTPYFLPRHDTTVYNYFHFLQSVYTYMQLVSVIVTVAERAVRYKGLSAHTKVITSISHFF